MLNPGMKSRGFYEWARQKAEALEEQHKPQPSLRVRLQVPFGIASVQTFSGEHIDVGPDRTIVVSEEDARSYIRDGWTKLAEWTSDEAAEEPGKP